MFWKGLPEQINQVVAKLEENGYQVHQSHGMKVLLGAVGKKMAHLEAVLETMPGVEKVIPILVPYKLTDREFKKPLIL